VNYEQLLQYISVMIKVFSSCKLTNLLEKKKAMGEGEKMEKCTQRERKMTNVWLRGIDMEKRG
jgi:hypothetical protein